MYYKMIMYYKIDSITNDMFVSKKKNNEKWTYIPDHPYRILIIGGSR